jgi:hypothetical protein
MLAVLCQLFVHVRSHSHVVCVSSFGVRRVVRDLLMCARARVCVWNRPVLGPGASYSFSRFVDGSSSAAGSIRSLKVRPANSTFYVQTC